MKKTLGLIVVLALSCGGLRAQSTNIVVTVQAPPPTQTVHRIKIPAGMGPALRAALLPQIDPQYASVTGQSAVAINLRKNPDGSWSGVIVFQ